MNDAAHSFHEFQGHTVKAINTESISYSLSDKLVLLSDSGSIGAESISTLTAQILSQHVQDFRRAIAFCTPSSKTGCTFLAANVAVGMARAGVSTLLIDGNLRTPAVQDYFTPSVETQGLLQALHNEDEDISPYVHHDVIPNLSVLYTGGTSNESGLVASSRCKALITNCMRDYDLTIVDTPPANQSSDALRLANYLRYALVVVRKDHSYLNDVRRLVADLKANRSLVVGTYLNDI